MNFNRKSYKKLLEWKENKHRKPLIIRGARQVGKSTLVQMFASEFSQFISLNLEKEEEKQIFETIHKVDDIINAIWFIKKAKLNEGNTLLFIDEIQESPKAIQQLRYFYEEKPGLYVIAAGSLLEFALRNVPSFPVGRVTNLNMHPMDFEEFLEATNNQKAVEILNAQQVPDYAHDTLLNLFHQYTILGGMPEVIGNYVENKSMTGLSIIYSDLWQSYKNDVEKYAQNNTDRKVIRHIIDTAPKETDRIKFEQFGQSQYRSREVGDALRTLDLARIIQLIYPTTSLKPPVISNLKKRPRLQFLDTGLLNHALNIQGEMIAVKDLSDFYRGKIIAHIVTQELIASQNQVLYKPHFWVREDKNSNAEVDLVYHHNFLLIPIEIKSASAGRLRSLHQFINQCDHHFGVRIYAGRLKVEKLKTTEGKPFYLLNLPYYLSGKLSVCLDWFVNKYNIF